MYDEQGRSLSVRFFFTLNYQSPRLGTDLAKTNIEYSICNMTNVKLKTTKTSYTILRRITVWHTGRYMEVLRCAVPFFDFSAEISRELVVIS